jgi:cysteine desulfurase
MVYLDYNATTPIDARVLECMMPWLTGRFGNAASREHHFGWDARDAVEEARSQVAGLIGALEHEIVFTSGATEGIVTVLSSFAARYAGQGVIVTAATEHDAVLTTSARLRQRNLVKLRVLPTDGRGVPDPYQLEAAIRTGEPTLVTIMAANNELGTLYDTRSLAAAAQRRGAAFLCDLTQAVGRCDVDVARMGIDYAAFSSHKIYGPKGVGALYARATSEKIEPLIPGTQENGGRGGTVNVCGIVGFGAACRICHQEAAPEVTRCGLLRDDLERRLLSQLEDVRINAAAGDRLCNTSNICFPGVKARQLIRDLGDIAAAERSACAGDAAGPSHVLRAIGLSDEDALACVRFSLGRFSTTADIEYAAGKIVASVGKLRALARCCA